LGKEGFDLHVFQRLSVHHPIARTCPQGAAGILSADLTLSESGAMPECVRKFRTADPIIIQFDLPAGWSDAGLARKHFEDAGTVCHVMKGVGDAVEWKRLLLDGGQAGAWN
jgi:hypothetical protein